MPHPAYEKMMGKKKEMSDSEKKAKLAALKEAHGMASDMMKEGLNGAKKVSVMAPSEEGLKKGLEMAKKVVDVEDEELGEDQMEDMEMGEDMEDMSEGYEDQMDESMPMSPEEIDAKIAELLELKEQLK